LLFFALFNQPFGCFLDNFLKLSCIFLIKEVIYLEELRKGELRKDYILDNWVYFVPGRKTRPRELHSHKHSLSVPSAKRIDFFAPGNEHLCPPEIGRIPDKNGSGWSIRWFENKFPALTPEGSPDIFRENDFFVHSSNFGFHEIIVETPNNEKQLHDFSVEETAQLLRVYSERILALGKKDGIKYVLVFKNFGAKSGASIIHSHSQVIATSLIPPIVAKKVSASNKFIECPYCRIIEAEKHSPRLCFENEFGIAFCPYASVYNYECWIFPKSHLERFEDFDFEKTAELLYKVLARLKKLDASYCFAIHYAPKGSRLHAHIVVMPQIATWGGFERGGGFVINTVLPEDAARFYRGEE